jgi:hypothetical protein
MPRSRFHNLPTAASCRRPNRGIASECHGGVAAQVIAIPSRTGSTKGPDFQPGLASRYSIVRLTAVATTTYVQAAAQPMGLSVIW